MTFPKFASLKELVAAEFRGAYREDLATITGPRSDQQIAELVERLALEELGVQVRLPLFATKSVGAVFGLKLVSGERVVLKLFNPTQSVSELVAMQGCIGQLASSGFPLAPPCSRLFQTDDGIVGAFYAFAEGERGDGHEPTVRRELARTLAELAGSLARMNLQGLPLAPTRRDVLWPGSHRSFLTLDELLETKWIDQIARRAQAHVRGTQLPLMPAHLDWGVKNVRFRQERVRVVYDWDSLFAASEAEMVGRAAAQFTAQWYFPAPLTPTPAEARAFVDEYEQARGRCFCSEEREVLAASADYLVAQVARFEFASGAPQDDGYLALLRSLDGAALMDGSINHNRQF